MKSKFLEENEVSALRAVMPEAEWLPLAVSMETGLRVGDVVALRRAALQPDGVHYVAAKTGKPGVAPISERLRGEIRAAAGRSVWLFPSPRKWGKHLTRQAVWARLKSACIRAGIPPEGVSPHALRKTFAVRLYHDTGSMRKVQEALQHDRPLTTELYALADWSTGENAGKPITRGDLQFLVRCVLDAIR